MLLTDNEMDLLTGKLDIDGLTRAVERAVLEKLCAGVSMPLTVWVDVPHFTYTAEQLRAYGAACRVKALEDAAVVCDDECSNWDHDKPLVICATAIRALRGEA